MRRQQQRFSADRLLKGQLPAVQGGAGDAVFTMWNGLAEVAGSILFLMLFLHVFHLGENSIWFSHIPTVIVAALMAYLRYRSGGWKKGLEA